MRARLLQLIRSLGLAHALDRVRYFWSARHHAAANARFRQANPEFPLPPDYLMYESYKLDYASYQRTGKAAAEWIRDTVSPYLPEGQVDPQADDPGIRPAKPLHILDWGCGPGRVVRHLPAAFGVTGEYFGCDPNSRSIEWCQSALPGLQFELSELMPPLPFADQNFDLLYGISILTHLSEAAHLAWLEELARVLVPGGLALLTTHGPVYTQKLTTTERKAYEAAELVVRGKVQEGHRVFTAFQPPAYFRTLVAPWFEVKYYQAGVAKEWGLEQDTWVLERRG